MLRILFRLFAVMVLFAGLYLIYINTNFNSIDSLKKQKDIKVQFQNLPEIILPLKENFTGYQYELVRTYLISIDKNNITLNDRVYDMAVYYSSEVCNQCLKINDEDLLLVTNDSNTNSVDIEIPELFKEIKIDSSISDRYEVNIYNGTIDDLINDIDNNLISNTILTRSTYLFYKKYFPSLKIKKKIGNVKLVWSFPNDDGSIKNNVIVFLESDNTKSFINQLRNRYYSENSISSYIFIGSRLFISDMITKLPTYEVLFKKASQEYNLDWKLLAAISYQESKWNNNAVSPTGVRGLMMLTKSTANMLSVDRLKPNESIFGGAKYFNSLLNKYSSFNESSKINLALASYNAGPNHINDVILLAKKNNENLENWSVLRKYLYKLNQKEYYKKMRFGYARGWEAVQYVENVKQYYDILTFLETKDEEYKNNFFEEVPNTL